MDGAGIRLDKWLWQARFFKTRGLASKLCAGGKVRVDGVVVRKAHYSVRVGHVLTFPQAKEIRVVRIEALGLRRGPAAEARLLYSEIGESGIVEPAPAGPGSADAAEDHR